MEDLAAAMGAVAMMAVIGWIIRTGMTSRRQTKIATLQAELQAKLLDRFGSAEEMLRYLESDSGTKFLETTLIERKSPYGRILASVQTGVVLAMAGGALTALHRYVPEGEESMMFLGVLLLFLGFAFLISAAATYWLSKKWGLLDSSSSTEVRAKI
jgi:hypothetical protein